MAMNRKSVPRKPRYFLRMTEAHFFDLLLDGQDDDFEQVLPAGTFQADGKFAGDEF